MPRSALNRPLSLFRYQKPALEPPALSYSSFSSSAAPRLDISSPPFLSLVISLPPPARSKARRNPVVLNLSTEVKERLRTLAQARGESMGGLAALLVEAGLDALTHSADEQAREEELKEIMTPWP